MFENRDNDPLPQPEGQGSLPPRPFTTFTPQQCAEEIAAQLEVEEIHTAIRNSVRCCVDSIPWCSTNPSDIVCIISALKPLQKQPFDEDGDNTFDYCLRSVLSTYFSGDPSSLERRQAPLVSDLALVLANHTRATQDAWAEELVLTRLLASDIRLSPEEKSSLARELISRELQDLPGTPNNSDIGRESRSKSERIFEIGEVILDVVSVIEGDISPQQPPSMDSARSYVSCWLKHLRELDPARGIPLGAFDNEHTRHLLGESFRFYFSQSMQHHPKTRAHESYIRVLAKFFTSLIDQQQPQPSSWFIHASEAYCLHCSLVFSRDILTTSHALRRLATSPLLAPESHLTPTLYTIKSAEHENGHFTISATQRFAYSRQTHRTVPIRDVSITQGSTVLTISFWQDERTKTSADVRFALDFRTPRSNISLRGPTAGGLQAYVSDGPLCLPTNPSLPGPRHTESKGFSTFQNGDYLVPIRVDELRSILRLTSEAAMYLHPSCLVSENQFCIEA